MKTPQLGLPYMGSKRKIAKKILDYICSKNPSAKYFFDLFGGGGAVSFEALRRRQFDRVIYNELDTGVVKLLEKIRTDGVTPEFFQWVDRETFHRHKRDDTWFGGLVKTVWSFGSDQRTYMFSPKNEKTKKILHEIIVNKSGQALDEFQKLTSSAIPDSLLSGETINERRLSVMRFLSTQKKRQELEHLQRIQHLDNLRHLERLELSNKSYSLERLELSNKSYSDVLIDTPVEQTIVYLDPPYEKTGGYPCKISHDELYSFIEQCPYKIYLSSYDAPFDCVLEIPHRCSFSVQNRGKRVVERLFCNRREDVEFSLTE